MNKIISVIVISALLLLAVVLEQVYVHDTLNKLLNKIDIFDFAITKTDDINSENIIELCKQMDEFWTENERILCLSINHNDLNNVGEQIKKIKVYVEQNKKDECVYELDILRFYAESYKHVMEINFQNLL